MRPYLLSRKNVSEEKHNRNDSKDSSDRKQETENETEVEESQGGKKC